VQLAEVMRPDFKGFFDKDTIVFRGKGYIYIYIIVVKTSDFLFV